MPPPLCCAGALALVADWHDGLARHGPLDVVLDAGLLAEIRCLLLLHPFDRRVDNSDEQPIGQT